MFTSFSLSFILIRAITSFIPPRLYDLLFPFLYSFYTPFVYSVCTFSLSMLLSILPFYSLYTALHFLFCSFSFFCCVSLIFIRPLILFIPFFLPLLHFSLLPFTFQGLFQHHTPLSLPSFSSFSPLFIRSLISFTPLQLYCTCSLRADFRILPSLSVNFLSNCSLGSSGVLRSITH